MQPPVLGSGKSFFLRRLLREVIFAESGLAGADLARQRALRAARRGVFAAMTAASVALAAAWTTSYFANVKLIESAEAAAGAARREIESLSPLRAGEEAKLVSALNRLRDLRQAEPSWTLRFGLYQGAKLDAQAERAYRNMLVETLLPHLARSDITSMRLPENLQKDLSEHIRAARAEGGTP